MRRPASTPISILALLTAIAVVSPHGFSQDVALNPATSGNFRFKDMLGQVYGAEFIQTFSYAGGSVVASFDVHPDKYLYGTITASNLKPNFAYQIKLIGRPSKAPNAADPDDATNERIGRIGRWWRVQPNPGNARDADREPFIDNPDYVFEGYLVMAFFVTDSSGNAAVPFIGNNSYHVLWRKDQRQPSSQDGPAVPITLPGTANNAAYDAAVGPRSLELYGEYEPPRALPGTLAMPDGTYRCNLVLTEESFHDNNDGIGGSWALAMSAPIEFTVPAIQPPTEMPITIEQIVGTSIKRRPGHDTVTVEGSINLPAAMSLSGQSVEVSVLGVTRTFTLNARGKSNGRPDSIVFSRRGPGWTGHFEFTLARTTLGLPAPLGATLPVRVTLAVAGTQYGGSIDATVNDARARTRLTFKRPRS